MITEDNPESPNLNSTYYTTPSTIATSTFASGSPMMHPEACFTDSPASAFSFNFVDPNDRRRASMDTYVPFGHEAMPLSHGVPTGHIAELNFESIENSRHSRDAHTSSLELLSSLNEDAVSLHEDLVQDLEQYLQSDPFKQAGETQDLFTETIFEAENPEEWFIDPPPLVKKETSHTPPLQNKTIHFHNSSPFTNPRIRKTKSFTYSSSKKPSSAGPATPLLNFVSEFHVNEGIFPIQDETPSFLKQLSYSSVHKRNLSSKPGTLRRSKTATNLCINPSPRSTREHRRSMEAGLVSFQLQLNSGPKS